MEKMNVKTMVLAGSLLSSAFLACPLACAGSETVNGGDPCEQRIQEIRGDIAQWVNGSGPSQLDFSRSNINLDQYRARMGSTFGALVSCQDDPVQKGAVNKVCVNFRDSSGKQRISCNRRDFMNSSSEDQQYVLIHHEFAGLAGIETNEGDSSNYAISGQLTAFLQTVEVRKLSLTRSPVSKNGDPYRQISLGDPNGTQIDIRYSIARTESAWDQIDFVVAGYIIVSWPSAGGTCEGSAVRAVFVNRLDGSTENCGRFGCHTLIDPIRDQVQLDLTPEENSGPSICRYGVIFPKFNVFQNGEHFRQELAIMIGNWNSDSANGTHHFRFTLADPYPPNRK